MTPSSLDCVGGPLSTRPGVSSVLPTSLPLGIPFLSRPGPPKSSFPLTHESHTESPGLSSRRGAHTDWRSTDHRSSPTPAPVYVSDLPPLPTSLSYLSPTRPLSRNGEDSEDGRSQETEEWTWYTDHCGQTTTESLFCLGRLRSGSGLPLRGRGRSRVVKPAESPAVRPSWL